MNDTLLIAIGAAIGMVIREGMLGLSRILDNWQKNQEAQRAAVASHELKIIDRQEQQIARLESQVKEQQNAMNRFQALLGRSREREAKMQVFMSVLVDTLHKAGIAVDMPPDLLKPNDDDDADFLARTEAQKTVLAAAIDAKLLRDKSEGGHADSNS